MYLNTIEEAKKFLTAAGGTHHTLYVHGHSVKVKKKDRDGKEIEVEEQVGFDKPVDLGNGNIAFPSDWMPTQCAEWRKANGQEYKWGKK